MKIGFGKKKEENQERTVIAQISVSQNIWLSILKINIYKKKI